MSEWQDISTAPRDGTAFLAFDRTKNPRRHERHYETSQPVSYDDPRFYVCYFRTFYGTEEQGYSNPWGNRNDTYPTPTHWMPLPSPPQTTRGDG